MNNKLNKLVAKASAAAMIASMLLPISAARAAAVTDASDTMSAAAGDSVHTISAAGVTHTVEFTTSGATWDNTETVTLDYATAGFALDASTPTCNVATGTCTAAADDNTDIVTLTCTDAGGCNGAVTLGGFTGTNPGTDGSKLISIGGTGGVTGQYAVAISDNDQITVTASVDPSITFEIWADDEACSTTPVVDYTVDLGVLSAAAVTSSGDQDTDNDIDGICALLNTNAANGAVVTVKADSPNNDASLASSSVPTDIIPADADVDAGTSGWGICVNFVARADSTPTGTFRSDAAWDTAPVVGDADGEVSAVCDDSTHGASLVALTTTAQPILNTNTDGVANGLARMLVKASVSGTQPAHTDYTATLTFVATGTF